jgi:hypothetical protein
MVDDWASNRSKNSIRNIRWPRDLQEVPTGMDHEVEGS